MENDSFVTLADAGMRVAGVCMGSFFVDILPWRTALLRHVSLFFFLLINSEIRSCWLTWREQDHVREEGREVVSSDAGSAI